MAQWLFSSISIFGILVFAVIKMFSRSQSFGVLRNAMGAYALRFKVLANNIANVDTPGYQRSSVSFENKLQKAKESITQITPLDSVSASVETDDVAPSLEDELLQLTETQVRNHVATRAMRDHFSVMRTAITGRSG